MNVSVLSMNTQPTCLDPQHTSNQQEEFKQCRTSSRKFIKNEKEMTKMIKRKNKCMAVIIK